MVQYYWNPNFQQPNFFNQNPQQMVPPPVTIPTGRPTGLPQGEQSYIENILRLNIGKPGTFHFSFAHTLEQTLNVRNVDGVVKAAGRDHVIITETSSGHDFLFPMIYFDYAEFYEEMEYFPQTIGEREI
ncbi:MULTISPECIES: spore coat protein GerQ [Sporosarcina]|uniref:Spore coat protein gerQ n=2 Tax=Sporosarcina TaxID=1569 RepID=A0A380BD20_SPOPA|nr:MULTISPECIES: spore coat protein GerQ [Sporosarcina]AOV08884.1 spore coat protein GerQ [Sporosarcina ureilytica]MDS9472332.1 spore coat protein GerQ [Sporosarcina pasteurii]QBQ06311.1 spore coat protein GerQ [Sporosarcina pasteurii]SUI98968.1 Spore coat protein gerQ [Sporosarcina pasteurii]